MSHRRAKRIRKELRKKGIPIMAKYQKINGQIICSEGRRLYQQLQSGEKR